jgi:hypothetical protein
VLAAVLVAAVAVAVVIAVLAQRVQEPDAEPDEQPPVATPELATAPLTGLPVLIYRFPGSPMPALNELESENIPGMGRRHHGGCRQQRTHMCRRFQTTFSVV